MWILEIAKELLDHLKYPNFNLITSIKSFDFSTLYTTILHQKLKSMLATIIRNSIVYKNDNRRHTYLVLGRGEPYFVKVHSDSKRKYTAEDIIKMLEFLVDNIFVFFFGKGYPTDNQHSHWHKLCSSPSPHVSVPIRSGIHTVLALGR